MPPARFQLSEAGGLLPLIKCVRLVASSIVVPDLSFDVRLDGRRSMNSMPVVNTSGIFFLSFLK
jgi:hypothetical protein